MKNILIAFVAAVSVSGAVAGLPVQKSDFHIFVLAGQSNMSGRGTLTDANRVPNEREPLMELLLQKAKEMMIIDN